MVAADQFRDKSPEFWAVVKLVSQLLGYSFRGRRAEPKRIRSYTEQEVVAALESRNLNPRSQSELVSHVAAYSEVRARLLETTAEPNLMDRNDARALFDQLRKELNPPAELLPMNKQKGEKRHHAYLTCIVNMLTWDGLIKRFGEAQFDPNPRGPLTFSGDGMPLRTLFRWMDGAFPSINQPLATWEIKEYYGTTTFGSRVADGVYETALDGYELKDLRSVNVEVEHYLFFDDRFTWWDCGRSYLCRIVDMLHAGLVDAAFAGREVVSEWPKIVSGWRAPG